jgi:Fe-S cluster assembly iron-binding protein IscA
VAPTSKRRSSPVLTITPNAATVLDRARTEKGAPDDHGVRFYTTEEEGSGRTRLAFAFVDSPKDDDSVVEGSTIEAFVSPDVDRLIGDVTVDVKQEGDQMGLVVRRSTPS